MWVLLVLLFCVAPLHAEKVSLAQGDKAYAARSDLAQAKEALSEYQKAMTRDPTNVEACWKASRTAWWVADHAESRSEKLATFQKGIDYAKQAVALDPNSVEGHFWLVGNYGSYGETKGVLKSLSLVKPIRQEMAEVNRINERFQGGAGYRVLGVVDYQVPGIAGGSKKRALEELEMSLAIDPKDPFTHYYLAEYFKVTGDKKRMKEEWTTLKSLQVPADLQPEHEMLVRKGAKLFEK